MSDIYSFEPLWGVWKVESLLGEGSFGKVYKASREEFGRTYYAAIKHISIPQTKAGPESLFADGYADTVESVHEFYKNVVDNLIDEIDLLRKLQGNSNIVTYEDHMIVKKKDEHGYDIFIRMELLKSMTAVMRELAMTQSMVVKMGVDICSALIVLEQKKLIHRDIKPANIFISEDGVYKLGDFGVSRILEGTLSGMSKKGTYNYMAPEVYKGEPYNGTIDIYSLGIVMYRLLNGNRAPFLPLSSAQVNFTENEKAIARRMSGEDLPNPAFADDRLSEIILKACAYNPASRYKTPTELKEDLLVYATGKSPKVVPVMKSVTEDTVRSEEIKPLTETTKRSSTGALRQEVSQPIELVHDTTESIFADRTSSLYANTLSANATRQNSPAGSVSNNQPPDLKAHNNGSPQKSQFSQPLYQSGYKAPPAKRSNATLYIIVAVIALIIVSVAGYFLYNSFTTPLRDDSVTAQDASSSESSPTLPDPAAPSNAHDDTTTATFSAEPSNSAAEYVSPVFNVALASSTLSPVGTNTYEPEKVIDADLQSCWCENKTGVGIGEWIEISNSNKQTVSGIKLYNGYQKDQDIFAKNGHPTSIRIDFSDGTYEEFDNIGCTYGSYEDLMFTPRTTTYIRITILAAIAGTKYDDICISEIIAY